MRKALAAKVTDIAQVLAAEAGQPFAYKVIGILPGEKLHEILVSEEELVRGRDYGDYYAVQPWWSTDRYQEIKAEFASGDHLTGTDEVQRMIALADQEFEIMEMADGEFAKF